MRYDAKGAQNDYDVSPQRPAFLVFKIGLQPLRQVCLFAGLSSKSPNLSQSTQSGLECMALPIPVINLPEEFVTRL
jgi:hypothetical protein